MRTDCRERINPNVAYVQGYHGDRNYAERPQAITHNYAFRGFTGNWYFNSDRRENLVSDVSGNILRENGQPLAGYGLEVETECRGIRNQTVLAEVYDKIIFPVFKFGADMFKMQNDCTLHGDSNAEVITQVMTKSRIRNDYASWRAMFETYFPSFGITADSFHTGCGMHVNVSNACFGNTVEKQTEAVRKLFYIINKHYDLFIRAFYRDPAKTNWCGRMAYSAAKYFDLNNADGSHGNCLNMSHFPEGRIEIRLVGGQKDFFCFRNTMETVFHIVERCRTLKWSEVDNVVAIFKGCNQYVFRRLETECTGQISASQLAEIRANVKHEDLELRR